MAPDEQAWFNGDHSAGTGLDGLGPSLQRVEVGGHRRRFFACRGPTLGFKPKSTLIGPLDSAVPKRLGDDALATLREPLSNVVRNAEADAGEVSYLGWT